MIRNLGNPWSRRERALAGGLALINICLGVVVAAELLATEQPTPDEAAAAAAAADPQPEAVQPPAAPLPPLDHFADILKRPVFVEGRRPLTEDETEDGGPAGELALAGVTTVGSNRIALIRNGPGGKILRLREGQTVGGWTIRTISTDRVIIDEGTDSKELRTRTRTEPRSAPGSVR